MNTKDILNQLPIKEQNEVFETLKYFTVVYITFENGKFKVSINQSILDKYPEDFSVIGSIKNTDLYTDTAIDFFISQM